VSKGNSTQFDSNTSSDVCVGTGVLTAMGGESLEWSNGVLLAERTIGGLWKVDFTNENLAKLCSMENCEFSIAHLNHQTKWHISNVLYLNSVGKLGGTSSASSLLSLLGMAIR